jgi:hypothetical protein
MWREGEGKPMLGPDRRVFNRSDADLQHLLAK